MLTKLGEKFTHLFLKFMPDAFVFALILTIVAVFGAFFWLDATPLKIIESWYDGFFDLLAFGMQIVLIIITGFSIALSPVIKKGIDWLTRYINTPGQVYFFVVMIGMLLCLVSFGWIVITCVLARELARRVKGVNYPFLVACVYLSMNSWVMGLSSSIPLLLNTEKNYLIEAGIMNAMIPTSFTLGSLLNIGMIILLVLGAPVLMFLLVPKKGNMKEITDLMEQANMEKDITIKAEAEKLKLPFKSWSDKMNNSVILQYSIAFMGLAYIIYHFYNKGLDLNFNIMIFIFLMIGLFLHKSPMRYVIAMKRSSSNVSGILFQYPFYAGIMGIMLYTGLGEKLAQVMAALATVETYPFFAYLAGGIVNFAIPSAGGEFAVIGPSIIEAVRDIGSGLPEQDVQVMIARASMSIAYGESLSNLMQPFYLLLVMPVMAAGIKLQARDVMGYLIIPLIVFFILQIIMVLYLPI